MPKITEIIFKNYRAFWGDDNQIKIDEKNALIYGENGSGKSSLYQGLKEFFRASDVNWTIEQPPTHLKAENQPEFEVNVVFDQDFDHPIIFNGQPIEEEKTAQTFLLNSFLSYKEMLRTHFLEQHEFNEKFFKLLTETLLVEHELGDTTIGKALGDLQEKLSNPTDKAKLLEEIRKTKPDADEEDLDEIDPKAELDAFKSLFDEKLTEISVPLNKILSYFKQAITVNFEKLELTFDEEDKKLKGMLGLDVRYIEIDRINHLEILNEARLSALAISIYLAAIVTNPIVQKANYKILFLDDVFVGLDTSNRLPLLDILQKFEIERNVIDENGNSQTEKVKVFQDFQIFLTTYDRHWFEIARKALGNSWLFVEMYAGKKNGQPFEYPIIISPSDTCYQKAEKYANRKKDGNDRDIDFPAAGNYLRKEVEGILKNLLWGNYRFKNGENGQTLLREELQELWDSFTRMMTELGFTMDAYSDFGLLSKTVLNPLSHDNLDKPIYRAEIEKAFEFVNELRKLSKTDLLRKGENVYLNIPEQSGGNTRQFKLKAKESVFVFQQTGTKKTNALVVEFECKKYYVNTVDTQFPKQEGKLSKLFDRAVHGITAQPNASDGKDMLVEFTDINGKTLQQMIDEI